MALLGEPLDSMVQNLRRANAGYVSANATNKVVSQGFTTGPALFGYRLQGIGVNIEGSGSNYPDGPTSVSVAVHANSSGKPGAKLVDLVSPDEYAAGHSFFEAPPGTYLRGSTSYVLVWSHLGGTVHRLRKTSANLEDGGALANFSIANAFYRGAAVGSLSEHSGGDALEIAVYGEINTKTVVYIAPPPPPPPFISGVTGGGGAIVRCSAPPAESCGEEYDDVPGGNTVWSATMTVGTQILSGITFLGWDDFGSFTGASLTDKGFTFGGDTYILDRIDIEAGVLTLSFLGTNAGDIATQATRDKLTLHVGSDSFNVGAGTLQANQQTIIWTGTGLTLSAGDSVALKLIERPTPNAYGYRTIWNALMTAEEDPNDLGNTFGYRSESYGKLTNNLIVRGRTDRGIIDDQFRYPWSGYEVDRFVVTSNKIRLGFNQDAAPNPAEAAGWTLSLGGGVELPFADASRSGNRYTFNYDPSWTDGDQVLVSIRTTSEVQNRVGQVVFRASDPLTGGNVHRISKNRWSGSSYISGSSFDVQGHTFSLELFEVIRGGTDDEDPVWITATFRAPNEGMSWTGYWEGEFEQFHTLYLHWYDNLNKRPSTYTLPLKTAATEGGIQRRGRNVSFVWVRTAKEFERRGLALARQAEIYAVMLATPQPATARSTTVTPIQNTGNQHGLYTPAPTVTSVEFTSNPGADQLYGPWSIIQATLTFDQDVTVRYGESKREAASIELEMNGETKTAYYERTDGKKVIFQYTVQPGDEEPVALKLPLNSLKLFSERGRQDGSIQNSEGADAVLDHYGLADTGHRVDAVRPEFASAQVSNDGTQVMVTLTEDIKSPSSYGSRRSPASPGAASPARSASTTGRCTGGARAPSRPGERCTPSTRSPQRYPAAWRFS